MTDLRDLVPPGVVNASQMKVLFDYARENNFAYPAVNVVSTNSINAALESAKECNSPIIIQLSYSGSAFSLVKGLDYQDMNHLLLGQSLPLIMYMVSLSFMEYQSFCTRITLLKASSVD